MDAEFDGICLSADNRRRHSGFALYPNAIVVYLRRRSAQPGGRLGAGRTGGAAAHRGARSQDVAQGSSRGGARLCRSRGRRVGGSPGPTRPGGRCGPALFRSGAGPRRRSCAPRRSRPPCCGRSRPGPGLRPGAARLRRAFRRPPRASGVSRCAMSLPA